MDSDPEQARTLDAQCPVSQILQLKLGAQVSGKQSQDLGGLGFPVFPLGPGSSIARGPSRDPSVLPPSCSHCLPIFSLPLPSSC